MKVQYFLLLPPNLLLKAETLLHRAALLVVWVAQLLPEGATLVPGAVTLLPLGEIWVFWGATVLLNKGTDWLQAENECASG